MQVSPLFIMLYHIKITASGSNSTTLLIADSSKFEMISVHNVLIMKLLAVHSTS